MYIVETGRDIHAVGHAVCMAFDSHTSKGLFDNRQSMYCENSTASITAGDPEVTAEAVTFLKLVDHSRSRTVVSVDLYMQPPPPLTAAPTPPLV